MPGSMGGMLSKIMGPLMTAGGLIAAPFTGGSTLPMALGGLQQMMGPGGVLGQKTSTPSLTPPSSPVQQSVGSATPSIPSTAGSGLSSFVAGAGPSSAAGAGVQGDMGTDIANNLLSPQNPFSQYAVAA